MLTDQQFATLIEALKIIHKTADKGVIDDLEDCKKVITVLEDDKTNKPDIDAIIRWIRKKDPKRDKYKVARCLVWYIAKKKLEIPEIQSADFPFCKCPNEYRYHIKRYK